MKQAILITAYKDIDRITKMLALFDDDFSFYIHIDKKSKIPEEEIAALQHSKNVKLLSREYSVNWAGFNHTKCILLLLKEAVKDKGIEYIHLISGQDYPIKSSTEIKKFFTKNKGSEFLAYSEFPNPNWPSANGGFDRIDYHQFYDLFNAKNVSEGKIIRTLTKIQKKFKLKRSRKYLPKLYGGWAWWSLSYACGKYVVDYTDQHPLFYKRFEHTAMACEMYVHIIIMNSPFAKNVINNDLRYINWSDKKANPDILDEKDYEEIVHTDAIFARKIEYPASEKLIEKIDAGLLKR